MNYTISGIKNVELELFKKSEKVYVDVVEL